MVCVCVDKHFDLRGSKGTRGKFVSENIDRKYPRNFYTVMLQDKAANLEFGLSLLGMGSYERKAVWGYLGGLVA